MIKCKVCGCEFTPVIDKHYIARDNGESGLTTAFKHTEGNLYDTFDCPACGCQIIAQERKRNYVPYTESIVDDIEENEEDE